MVRAQVVPPLNESTDPQLQNEIFLLAQLKSALISNGDAAPDVSHLSLPVSVVSMSGFDQTTARYAGGTHLSASAPSSTLSGLPCNRSLVFASSATLLLLKQSLVCCIHRLNPQAEAVIPAVGKTGAWFEPGSGSHPGTGLGTTTEAIAVA